MRKIALLGAIPLAAQLVSIRSASAEATEEAPPEVKETRQQRRYRERQELKRLPRR